MSLDAGQVIDSYSNVWDCGGSYLNLVWAPKEATFRIVVERTGHRNEKRNCSDCGGCQRTGDFF